MARLQFNEVWAGRQVADLLDDLNMMFEDVLHQAGQGLLPLDLCRVIIVHPNLDNPIIITINEGMARDPSRLIPSDHTKCTQ